jgi:hypothetical protein
LASIAIRERISAAESTMKAESGAQEGAGETWFGLQRFWTGPPRKWMISSMKLKLASLLDDLQEFLS